ncbi:sulfotransferase family protein [Thiorhodococcus fuscus]|uniref:Sulfotransferase family protein n=1 Tax=Thiorhodococcus fuscus TaxID=527200 RepID=A0ABW4YC36_9GAMM
MTPAPFIIGMGRSGTTLLRLMLDAHSMLAIPAETHFIPFLLQDAPRDGADCLARLRTMPNWGDFDLAGTTFEERLIALQPFSLTEAIRLFFGSYAATQRKPRWGDKTPTYVEQVAAIGALLPEARFVHLLRDGRDVALSYRNKWFGPGDDLVAAARLWRGRILTARSQAETLDSGRYLELRFEDLVREPEHWLGTVCDFLELPFEPEMLNYPRRATERLGEMGDRRDTEGQVAVPRERRLSIHANTSRPPDPAQSGKWRTGLTRGEVALFEREAGDLLDSLGYRLA